jgi:hypothetical protein
VSGLGELSAQLQVVHDDPETDRKATLNTVARCAELGMTPAETAEVLAALGLVAYESGGRYDPTGRRYRRGSPQSRSQGSALGGLPADAENPPTGAVGGSNGHPEAGA